MFLRVKRVPAARSQPLSVSMSERAITDRPFSLLAVTTRKTAALGRPWGKREGVLKLLAVEEQPMSLVGASREPARQARPVEGAACISKS
jgi:hypothetical protein